MASTSDKLIFIDFDGVLRRSGSPLYRLEPDLVDNLVQLLGEIPDLQVVISSSWREVQTLEQLKAHFPMEVRERIVGATPLSKQVSEYQRYKEILAYLKFHRKDGADWLAVDDATHHFPESAPVVIVDSTTGLDDKVLEKLRMAFLTLAIV